MANSLGVGLKDLGEMALKGNDISITSMCTVFAESEVISLIGSGTPRYAGSIGAALLAKEI